MPKNLKDQAVNSIIWTTIKTVLTSFTGPLLLLVKSQYLTRTEFGVMAIINIFIGILNVIENFGFTQAVIQKDEVSKNERSSLFFFEVIFCFVVGGLLVLSAPVFADIFDMPALSPLLSMLSLIVILNGPVILFTSFLEKEFHFKELSIIQIIREGTILVATTALLATGFGLEGVVWGQIIAVAVMCIMILFVSFRHNLLHLKLHFNFLEIKSYITFGLYVSGKQMLTQLTNHADELIIGYFLSAEVLGLYHFAKNILGKLRMLITTSFAKVLFPILSKVKNNTSRLTKTYNNISKYIGIFAFPIFIGIAITAHLFIPVIFGEKWIESIPFFQILSLSFIPYILTANLATSLLYSVGRPNVVLYTDIVVNLSYIGLLLVLSTLGLGIFPIVWLYTLYIIVKTMTLQFLTSAYLQSTFRSYLSLFKNIVIVTIAMVAAVFLVQYLFRWVDQALIELIISGLAGAAVYMTGTILLDKKTLIEMKDLVKRR